LEGVAERAVEGGGESAQRRRRETCEGSGESFKIEVRFELLKIHDVVVEVIDVGGVIRGILRGFVRGIRSLNVTRLEP
jgi:hypothetical protein